MIVYFADRYMNILGNASTMLPYGFIISEDVKTEDIESGVASFECKIGYNSDNRTSLERMAAAGNYLLMSSNRKGEFYTIIECETDTKNQTVYIYAEDAGLDLLNEIAEEYTADEAHNAEWYINKYISDTGFEIGVNEIPSTTTKMLSWDGESTCTERIADIADRFGGYEISYSFDSSGMEITNKYVNIYKNRGKDVDEILRLNYEIDSIVIRKSVANIATALICYGATLDGQTDPVDLTDYSYDDGDFYTDGNKLKSREALKEWTRYQWEKKPRTGQGHIVRTFNYDTESQKTLCDEAIKELKKLREIEVNYEVDIKELPENIKIGDRVNIVDDEGKIYVSARLLKLEVSECDNTVSATLGEYLIKTSGISKKVAELASDYVKAQKSAAVATKKSIDALAQSKSAQTAANSASSDAAKAQSAADKAQSAADKAQTSATAAQTAANNAQAAVDIVENNVTELQITVTTAQTAADNAYKAAETADAKAVEASNAAAAAAESALTANNAAQTAQSTADTAKTNAAAAQSAADTAKAEAEAASTTAAAAKLDAQNAQKDIDALGENLTTLSNTVQADYARKTDLTEATASLQSQISQNAAEISSTVTRVQTIDETANNAAEQAAAAQTAASTAKAAADQATADAAAAQTAADQAASAAASAQSEADKAKTAAASAQSVANKADADLAAAKEDLATVTSRVDATEEDITAAQAAVDTAQAAADKANADAAAAASKAAAAQSKADTAATNATNAQTAADNAAAKATAAQKTANEAIGNAATAQSTADAAKAAATAAQNTADTAKANATAAQTAADQAAAKATAAQTAADQADAKAKQAATDLATAQQNLADVTSRVDATEEEVTAAQAAVTAAQAAADQAASDAAAAQSTANTAKKNAATAQSAADTAKAAADAAQIAADEAQAAADKAQADVDALAVRVTTAETKITQNSEKIELAATRTEVTETLGGYYTKEQADAAIQIKANEITSNVSNTYATKESLTTAQSQITQNAENISANVADTSALKTRVSSLEQTADGFSVRVSSVEDTVNNMQIGCTQLLPNTKTMEPYSKSSNVTVENDSEGFGVATFSAVDTLGWNAISTRDPIKFSKVRGKTVTFSILVRSDDFESLNADSSHGLYIAFALCTEESTNRTLYKGVNQYSVPLSSEWTKVTITATLSDSFFSSGTGTIDSTTRFTVQVYNYSTYSMQVKKLKLEIGSKATDWSPSPEDVDNKIDDTASEIYDTIETNSTTITETCESIILEALTEYTATGDFESFKETVNSQLTLLSDQMELKFTETTAQLESVNDDLQEKYNTITKYFAFDINGLTIGQEDNPNKVVIDNDEISILVNDAVVQKFDADGNALTPSLKVTESFDLFGYIIEKDDSGNVNCIYKG